MASTNFVQFTIAQVTNATKIPSTSPAVTNNGLPFGGNVALSPPVGISGDVIGFGDFSGLVLAYFGGDSAGTTWTTGSGWVAAVSTAGTYTASIPVASGQFAAVVMTEAFWTDFLAANPASGGTVTVAALPSPQADPGQVKLAATMPPGQGRSVNCIEFFGGSEPRQRVLAPGAVFVPQLLGQAAVVQTSDQHTAEGQPGYQVGGQRVAPTSQAFIAGLLNAMVLPYVPTTAMTPRFPTDGSIWTLIVQAVSPTGNQQGGYICVMLYQNYNTNGGSSVNLLTAVAGPNGYFYTNGVELYAGTSLQQAQLQLTGVLNVFSDAATFNIVSASEEIGATELVDFLKTLFKLGVDFVEGLFAVVAM